MVLGASRQAELSEEPDLVVQVRLLPGKGQRVRRCERRCLPGFAPPRKPPIGDREAQQKERSSPHEGAPLPPPFAHKPRIGVATWLNGPAAPGRPRLRETSVVGAVRGMLHIVIEAGTSGNEGLPRLHRWEPPTTGP